MVCESAGGLMRLSCKKIALTLPGCALAFFLLAFSQGQVQVGYSVITAQTGGTPPVGTALFSYTKGGVLLWEAGVAAVEPIRSGRVFVDRRPGVQTAIALVNPSSSMTATLVLRDSSGVEVDRTTLSLSPGQHVARFLGELALFPSIPAVFTGSLTFETPSSQQRLAAITLRAVTTARGEQLYTTLPVANLSATLDQVPLVFPQIVAGSGYTTQVVLINRSSQRITGQISFTAPDGTPLPLQMGSVVSAQFSYQIEAHGTYRAELTLASGLGVGYAVVTPSPTHPSPSGTAIFQQSTGANLITEAGVAAVPPTTAARIFVDYASTETGVAIANNSNLTAPVTFQLMDRNGTMIATTTVPLVARGQVARFVHELFPALKLPDGFTGLMEITSPVAVAPVTLKQTRNRRGETILTTLPVADLARAVTAASYVFPHIAFGGEYTTRLISINSSKTQTTGGTVSFFQSNGSNMTLPLGGQTGSQFTYLVAAGGAAQFRPGNSATASRITLDVFNPVAEEIAVNVGNRLQLNPSVIDSNGDARDDFALVFGSASPEIASVDTLGRIQGIRAGFSTLTVSTGSVKVSSTITVAQVTSGAGAGGSAFGITGIAQDPGGQLFMAATQGQVILRSVDLQTTPSTYAGTANSPGFKDDERLRALFRDPAFLGLNVWEGLLYVSDSSNHVIRQINPGSRGQVQTLAGVAGQAGSRDGQISQATFKKPQGMVLDEKGFLWVVDSGNHTIRRINLAQKTIETIAGEAGKSGDSDGVRQQAHFNLPTGITLEPESLVAKAEREKIDPPPPPPPVTVIVADTGNGRLRRVKENGEVTTVTTHSTTPLNARNSTRRRAVVVSDFTFNSPTGVVVDPSGNIYVTESGTGQIKTVLRDIGVVSAVQQNTFSSPKGIAISHGGKLVVADSTRSGAQEIVYGKPEIISISPNPITNRGGTLVTIKGRNFSPDTLVIMAGIVLPIQIVDTTTITLAAPRLPSGNTTVTVQHRGGLAQTGLVIDPVSLGQSLQGSITTVAGGSTFAGDGSAASAATLTYPSQIVVDSAGNTYIADSGSHRIRRVDAKTGIITTVAGTGTLGFSGDEGPAAAAALSQPSGIALDAAGNLYIADTGNRRVRRVDVKRGTIATVAGTGRRNYSGDGGKAIEAEMGSADAVVLDRAGNLLIADSYYGHIRKVDLQTGLISNFAGNGDYDFAGDGGPATSAALHTPTGLAVDRDGNVYIADIGHHRIRKVDANSKIITTVAGNGQRPFNGDGGAAVSAALNIPTGITLDGSDNLYIADSFHDRVRRVDAETRVITTVAGDGYFGYTGDGVAPLATSLNYPVGVAVDSSGNLYIADSDNHRIRHVARVALPTAIISTLAGTVRNIGDNTRAAVATLASPSGLAIDAAGNVFVADAGAFRVRRISASTGVITTVAGSGEYIYLSEHENTPATSATLYFPTSVAVDSAGNLFIADAYHSRIRKVAAGTDRISTFAGNGEFAFSGDGGPATSAALNYPVGVAVDKTGNVFIADTDNSRIRRVDAVTGIITTVAGSAEYGFAGDDGPATAAELDSPEAVLVDAAGNLFISDTDNARIRRVDAATRVIKTAVGGGGDEFGFFGDQGPATEAGLSFPSGLALDAAGNLYVADSGNNRIRRIDAQSGVITTVAGNGGSDPLNDNLAARTGGLDNPTDVALDAAGTLYIADAGNQRVRAIRTPINPPQLAPNLRLYKPDGWDDGIVLSHVKGTHTEGNLIADGSTYLDWAVDNNGDLDIKTPIVYELWVDGVPVIRWTSLNGLLKDYYNFIEDHELSLPAGDHYLTLVADPDDTIPELDETDNVWVLERTWKAAGAGLVSSQAQGSKLQQRKLDRPQLQTAPRPAGTAQHNRRHRRK